MDSTWPLDVDPIIGGDLAVAFGYLTPACGVAVLPVTTMGLRDRAAGTVTTSSSFGLWKKLVHLDRDPRVAVGYHAREHGTATGDEFVLLQGEASFPTRPGPEWPDEEAQEAWDRTMAPRKKGRIWSWLHRVYYDERVPVTVTAERVTVWPDGESDEPRSVDGEPLPDASPTSQAPPKNGTGPRVPARKYRKRLARARHVLLGHQDADGRVTLRPVEATLDDGSLRLDGPGLPEGQRRAGLLAHWFEPRLIGQGSVSMTGWLEVDGGEARYHPHTAAGYAVPRSELLFSIGIATTRLGYRQAVKLGHVRDGEWQRPGARSG